MTFRAVLWFVGLVAGAAVVSEWLLHPATAHDRWHLLLILAVPAAIAAVAVPLLRRWVSGRASVAGAALVVGLCSLALGAATSSAASNAMFVSSHDFRLFLVVLLLSCGIALLVGWQLTRPLADDIARVGEVAERVAGGDLSARTGVHRADEVGRTAAAVDRMVVALHDADEERARMTAARQLLFTSVGHDLRTPLAVMRATLESVQDGLAPDPDRALSVVARELENVEALLDQLVEFARIEATTAPQSPATVALAEMTHEAVEALEPLAARRGVRLEFLSDGPGFVDGSAVDLRRVIRNPLDNAIAHAADQGVVRVELHEGPDWVELAILDDGPGFPPAFRDQAFEPFTRADSARTLRDGHAGLGLAITRTLTRRHGGEAWLGEGPGGDVRIRLPRRQPR